MLIAVPEPSLALKAPPLYAELAKELGLPLEAKILTRIERQRSLKSDQIHPNADGYYHMAEAIAQALRKHGAIK